MTNTYSFNSNKIKITFDQGVRKYRYMAQLAQYDEGLEAEDVP